MKKSTKQMIIVGFLAFTLLGSSIAFVIGSGLGTLTGDQQQQQGQATPTQFVVNGYLDSASHNNFLSRGYTLMEFHYQEGCCQDLLASVDELPAELEFQLVVQKIPDKKTYFLAESFRERMQFNATTVLQVLYGLCDVLAAPPPDCAFRGNSTQR